MIDASPELKAFLSSARSFVMADLYTFTLASGQVLRYTDVDLTIFYDGHNYSASGPLITRTGIRSVRGIEVDTLNITLKAGLQDTVLGESLLPFIIGRGFDGATVELQRAFMADWGQPVVGAVPRFIGRVADVDPADRQSAVLTVKSPLELLDTKVPRGVYRPACLRTVYSDDCGVDRALFETTGTVQAGASTGLVILTDVNDDTGYFDQGVIRFTSGANEGVARTVRHQVDDGTVSLILALPTVPSDGDEFLIYPGCPRTLGACTNKFNNRPRFRGFPFIPVAEAAL